MRVGAIDVGTNTTRLLAAESSPHGFRELDRRLLFTRLGQDVDSTGSLRDDAIKRTLAAIAEFCAVCGEVSASRIRITCTSAVRDALNRDEFLLGAKRLSGVDPEVLSGEQEARLSFDGATSELDPGLYLVCDIGGGSTEFVLGDPSRSELSRVSLDMGSVRMTERYLLSDPPATEEILTMEAAIDDALDPVEAALSGAGEAILVGVAGTVTSLAAMLLALEDYDPTRTHGLVMARNSVDRLYSELARMRIKERQVIPSLPSGRADVIVAGASILSRIMARWSHPELVVSEKDILDGLVLEMLKGEN